MVHTTRRRKQFIPRSAQILVHEAPGVVETWLHSKLPRVCSARRQVAAEARGEADAQDSGPDRKNHIPGATRFKNGLCRAGWAISGSY